MRAEGTDQPRKWTEGGRPQLDYLLRFDPETERAYEAERGPARARKLSVTILVGLIFYNFYNLTASMLLPDVFWLAMIFRLGIVTPMSIVLAVLVLRMGAVWRERLLVVGMLVAYAGPLAAFWMSDAPLGSYAFSELVLIVVFGNMLLSLRFRHAILFTTVTFVAAVAAVVTKQDLFRELVIVFPIQAFAAAAFTLVSNYLIERRRCDDYLATLCANRRAEDATSQTRQLEELSRTDPLTGLPNRRALDAEFEAAVAAGKAVSVLMIDIDHFKSFNDTLGHPEGDACLQRIADVFFAATADESVFCARFGGEEFTVLITDMPEFEGPRMAAQLVRNVAALKIPHPGRPDRLSYVTISVGVAARRSGDGKDIGAVIEEADDALYAAKRLGRNRFSVAGDLPERMPA